MKVAYTKMHGTGNVILVVDQRSGSASPPSPEALRELGNEATGPGFDQLMWIGGAGDAGRVADYRIYNADGSEVEQCGNGVRCVAAFLADEDVRAQSFVLGSPSGPVEARVDDDGLVTVSMGKPEFESARHVALTVAGKQYDVSEVSMGNPHCVLFVDDVDTAPVTTLGPLIEAHERYPERTNVEFARIRDRGSMDLRVFERGVGETAACGTGACAAVVAGQNLGLLDETVNVRLPGGQLVVSWRGGAEPVWLTGNAEYISKGFIDL